jgi:hypothetical protein
MATYWTIKYSGTEKTLEDWGLLNDFTADFANKAKSTVTFRTNERFDAGAPQFTSFPAWFRANPAGNPASQLVLLYRDRTAVGAGGTIYFAGYLDDPVRLLEGGLEHIQYQLHNVLWLFERNPFKQYRNQFAGWTVPGDPSSGASYVKKVCPEIYLGENWSASGALFKQYQQIQEVIDWMNESYNPTRRGAVGGMDATKDVVQAGTLNPAAKIPKNRVNTIFCIEAINSVLRWAPDAIFKVDNAAASSTVPPVFSVLTMAKWNYATDPPTFIDYTNLPEVTVNITSQQEKAIQLQMQSGRQLPGVILYYETSSTVDSVTVPILVKDDYPVGTSDFYPEVPSHAVQLEGSKLMHVKVNAITEAIADPISGSAAAKKAWWKKYCHTLQDAKIKDSTIVAQAASLKDEAGVDVDPAVYPRQLLGRPLPQWVKDTFGIVTKRAFIRAQIAYQRYSDSGQKIPDFTKGTNASDGHFLTHEVTVTNATTQLYETVQSFDSGETIPAGVAESVYRAVAIAQQAGTITLRDDQLRSDIYIGCRLKLIGPTTTFTNILPQQITARPCQGITAVRFGPSAMVDADALIELARATRFRYIYNMPSGRSDGFGSGGEEVDHSVDQARGNTIGNEGSNQLLSAVFKQS